MATKEFPKMLHGQDREGKPMTLVVKDAAAEKAAKAKGWSEEPKQDHGPTEPEPAATPKSEAAAAKAEAPKKKPAARKK